MTTRLLIATAALFLVVTAPASAAAVEPDPGDWSSSPVRGKGARAVVEFVVDGEVSPSVEVSLRRCGSKPWSRGFDFGSVPVSGGAFKARVRGAKVVLKLEGTFDSEFEAHGTVRGTVKLRRGGKRVTCKLPKLSWTAERTAAGDDEEAWDEESYDEEYAPDDYDPETDEEYGDDEGEYGEDDPEDEYPEDE
jgi:hypothetical protein